MTDSPFKYHQDPGHGWLEVTASDIAALGLTPASFSRYSYVTSSFAGAPIYFLEEDCDMTVFMRAFRKRFAKDAPLEAVYHDHHCFIRVRSRIAA